MVIGLDLDNTLARYDDVFAAEAVARGLAPRGAALSKEAIRDRLRAAGREDDWTELQGWVYGPGMEKARPFPGAREFVAECRRRGIAVRVISHRTRRPFRGPDHDLHASARRWLESNGFLDAATGVRPGDVHLEETKAAKLARIAAEGCTHFIDDLPEFLAEPAFPAGVFRLHFDPSGSPAAGRFPRALSWAEAAERLLGLPAPELARAAEALLARAGLKGPFALEPVAGSANNRVYRARGASASALLKSYFARSEDPRDRLGAETAFVEFARAAGADRAPRLLAADPAAGLAAYEWIDGRRLSADEADAAHVAEAADFLRALNRRRELARGLPDASEACFSAADHVALVSRRARALAELKPVDALEREAAEFARGPLSRALESAAARAAAAGAGSLAPERRLVSPSDFGFHNALLAPDGRLRFVDFEYAGWDDPAKTICDFFLQPAVPAPESARAAFAAEAAEAAGDPTAPERAAALAPLYRVKWACILLNDFLPAGRERRLFALGADGFDERRRGRLDAARRRLQTEGS
jgi:hypothetical protein